MCESHTHGPGVTRKSNTILGNLFGKTKINQQTSSHVAGALSNGKPIESSVREYLSANEISAYTALTNPNERYKYITSNVTNMFATKMATAYGTGNTLLGDNLAKEMVTTLDTIRKEIYQ